MRAHVSMTLAALWLAGCSDSKRVEDVGLGPGTKAWGETDLSCGDDDDCAPGEGCYEGTCQPRHCIMADVSSLPPLGPVHGFVDDLEIAAVDGDVLRFFAPDGDQLSGDGSLAASGVVDLISGRAGPTGESAVGVVTKSAVTWHTSSGAIFAVDLPATPAMATSGDLDGDGSDDVVAVTAGGRVIACTTVDGECGVLAELGKSATAVAVGWVAGVETVVVATSDSQLHAIGIDGSVQVRELDDSADVLVVADLDGDATDEIVALHRSWLLWSDDRLSVYHWGDELVEQAYAKVDGDSPDVAAGDIDGDGRRELLVLTQAGAVRSFHFSGLSLQALPSRSLGVAGSHLALYDRDDDSARVELEDEPTLVTGNPVPIVVAEFPPYHRDFSVGDPELTIGRYEGEGHSSSSSVSMNIGVEVGVSVGGEGLLSGGLSVSLDRKLSRGTSRGHYYNIGQYLDIPAQPELYGDAYGAVLLGVGCYHSYRYRVVDPRGLAGSLEDQELVVLVPVGGNTSLWSTPRYNELAKARGDLPTIDIAARLGNLASYPNEPRSLDGELIPEADRVFPDVPGYLVSDVADISWNLIYDTEQSTKESSSISLTGKVTVGVGGFSVGGSATVGLGNSSTISIDQTTSFRGSVPPMPDDPTTPEDEYATYAYSFMPTVYRHHYTTPSGESAAFYALSFHIGSP